ncbi:hypothetical protein CFAEC_11825 [Corynebacterium faecale]|uniref:GAP1-N2 domain-containing protein n=1 Tax=Corynebacterium faecale TaxID=1758466 RepID=UPI0025B4D3B2|nr:hypothetical protein [Corynebacterium faecale]WJY93157.1 hypothetical protein CFAEC_11825 [Corynebacterium faecale]
MRWTHVTYASFKGTAGRGGWKVGSWSAHATREDLQLIAEVSPTHIETVRPFDDFISSEEIEALPRRFEYRPLTEQRSLLMQSVPAGKDATGRPGNVFTHAVIDADLDSALQSSYPISLYRSADLLTPFRAAAVNTAELADDLGEPRPGPMSDLTLSWMMVDSMFGNRRQHFHQLQDVLQAGERTAVLVLNNTNEAAYWIQALSSTLTPNEARRLLHYSTFERAVTLPARDKSVEASSLFVVPGSDRELLVDRPDIIIIDPEQPVEADAGPQGTWAQMTAGLYTAGFDPEVLVAGLINANANLDADQRKLARFGDGLARFIRGGDTTVGKLTRMTADQHLFGAPTAKKTPEVVPAQPEPQKIDILTRASEVIHSPRRVVESQEWTSLRHRADSPRWIGNMSEQAINNIEKLHDSPAQELVSYLDFLLKTELVASSGVKDPDFRSSFADFPAMANWRRVPFTGAEHPLLRDLLIDAERDARNRRATGVAAGRPVLVLDHLMQHLNMDRTLGEVITWLDGTAGRQIIAEINAGVQIQTGRNYFLWDLLRIYFGIALTTEDDEVHKALTTLAVDSATRYVESRRKDGKDETVRRFEKFGEDFVKYDSPEFLINRQIADRYREILRQDAVKTRLSRDRDVDMIFTIVAESVIRAVHRNNSGKEVQP